MAEELEVRLTRKEAAAWLTGRGYKTSRTTLAKLACVGGGPRYARFGRLAGYTIPDLIAWVNSRLTHRAHTSEPERS